MSWDFWTLRIDVQDEYLSLAERDDAVESMRELAENGDVHAQYFMGKLYLDGSIVIPDSEAAMNWFHKASTSGYAPAQYALGKLLLSDDASVHDSEAGIQWLEHAAYNGNHYASYRLGKEYLKGEVVTSGREGIRLSGLTARNTPGMSTGAPGRSARQNWQS